MNESSKPVYGLIAAGLVIFAVFGIHRYLADRSADETGAIGAEIEALPASASGTARGGTAPLSRLNGLEAVGQVAAVYVMLGSNFYITVERAPASLRKTAARFAVVEFPDPLARDFDAPSVMVKSPDSAVEIGDVVAVRFVEGFSSVGHDNVSRVTEVIAAHDSEESKALARRIAARKQETSSIAAAEAAGRLPGLLSKNSTH